MFLKCVVCWKKKKVKKKLFSLLTLFRATNIIYGLFHAGVGAAILKTHAPHQIGRERCFFFVFFQKENLRSRKRGNGRKCGPRKCWVTSSPPYSTHRIGWRTKIWWVHPSIYPFDFLPSVFDPLISILECGKEKKNTHTLSRTNISDICCDMA